MSYKSGIIDNLLSNQLEITFPDGDCETIGGANIVSESMKLKQAISDGDELRFGGCIASQFTIDLLRTEENGVIFPGDDLAGKWIAVKMTQTYADPDELVYPTLTLYPSGNLYPGKTIGNKEFWIFSGYIDSAKVNKNDKNIITITAFDALAKLYEADATDYLYDFFRIGLYKHLSILLTRALSSTFNKTIDIITVQSDLNAILNESYVDSTLGSTAVGSFDLYNEYWLSRKDKISFGALIKSICEIVCVFGVIIPDDGKGKFTFKRLNGNIETYEFYESLEAEEYMSTGYTDFQFSVSGSGRTGKSVIGGGISDAADDAVDKIYDFSDNILILQPYTSSSQGRTSTPFDDLINKSSVGTRLAINAESENGHTGQCAFSSFQPLFATVDGRCWVNVGDSIEILVNKTTLEGDFVYDENDNIIKESVKTYVLSRTLTGIQALTDKIEVKGAR